MLTLQASTTAPPPVGPLCLRGLEARVRFCTRSLFVLSNFQLRKKWQTMLAPASDLQPPPTPLATPPPPRPSLCRHAPLRICQGADQRRFDGSSRSPNSRRSVASSVRIYFELVAKGPPVPVAWRAWLLRGKVGAMAAGGEAEGRWNRREEYEGVLR